MYGDVIVFLMWVVFMIRGALDDIQERADWEACATVMQCHDTTARSPFCFQ